MRNLKSLIPVLFTAFVFTGCNTDDLRNDIDELKNRVESLEAQVSAINENMNALQVLVEGKKTIQECSYNEETKTWTLVLSDGTTLQLYQGEDGVANTPKITIDDTDNTWVVDGVDTNVPATGDDATVPVFSVDAEGYWMVDYDGEGGEAPKRIQDSEGNYVLAKPTDASGTGGDTFFESVKINGDFLDVTLTEDGKTYSLPIVPELLCKINVEDLDGYKNEILTVGYGESKEIPVKIKGENYFVTAPSGWIAQLSELSGEDATITLTAPAEPSTTLGTRATADNTIDLTLQVNKGAYWAVAKIKVEAVTIVESYKDLYDKGQTITVNGVDINKDVYGEAGYVNSSDFDFSAGGVFFISPNVEVNYTGTATYKTLILIGDNSTKKSTFNIGAAIKLNQETTLGQFICYNLDIKATSTFESYFVQQNGNNEYENALFYDCKIKLPSNQPLSYISTSTRSFKNFTIKNCIVDCPNDTKGILGMNESTATYSSLLINNNIFYNSISEDDELKNIFHLYDGKNTTLSKVEVTNNTFINISTSTTDYVYAATLPEVIAQNNIIYFSRTMPNDCAMFRVVTENSTQGSICSDNVYYKTDTSKKWTMFYSGKKPFDSVVEAELCSENPFDTAQGATFDMENGMFVPIAAYANYGAKFE